MKQCLINKRENNGLKELNDPKALIEYSNNMPDVCENTEEHNPSRKCNKLVFDDMNADMVSNKNLIR